MTLRGQCGLPQNKGQAVHSRKVSAKCAQWRAFQSRLHIRPENLLCCSKQMYRTENSSFKKTVVPAGKSLLHALPHPWDSLLTVNDWHHLSKPEQRVSEGWTQREHMCR